jgi:hypothetical protein
MRASRWSTVLPFVPFLAGLALSTWRFRLQDAVGGLALGLGGAIAMIVVAVLHDCGEGRP